MRVKARRLRAKGGTVQTARNFPIGEARSQNYSQKVLKAKTVNPLIYSIHIYFNYAVIKGPMLGPLG